uniref:CUE domain-containing protein n=1 Tax=Trypanosoma congolense (strain IL3000) TaxID=1068625 RepID=G0UX95_TRYCI|nr:conserved hypothetical protein [Trypanosoma congolense IL3000]
MTKTLQDAFPDSEGAICGVFSCSSSVSEKLWEDAIIISQSDERTFWTITTNYKNMAIMLELLVNAVNTAHSSAHLRRLKHNEEVAVLTILVRLATTTSVPLAAGASVSSVAKRLGDVVPPSLLPSVCVALLRHSGQIASTAVTALFLINPTYLCAITSIMNVWCKTTSTLAVRCVRDLSRGRHQRLAGDVIPLFEQLYRHVKGLWSLAHCVPFLADYVPLSRILCSLRVVVDFISPALQHFILTCTSMNSRREQLSKANSVIVNAALNAATVLVLFRKYRLVAGEDSSYCVDHIVNSTYEVIAAHVTQKTTGVPALLLKSAKHSLMSVLNGLVPPSAEDEDRYVGEILSSLTEPPRDCADFAAGFAGARPRFSEVFLLELVHQGFHIDKLLEKKLITTIKAEELGASERVIAQAIAGIIEESQGGTVNALSVKESGCCGAMQGSPSNGAPCASSRTPPTSSNPLVRIVLDVMPHFNVKGIEAALNYYNNDVEHFILDASVDNIVPHILEQLNEPTHSDVEHGLHGEDWEILSPSEPSGTQKHFIGPSDYDNELQNSNLNLLIGSDLYEAINGFDESVIPNEHEEEFTYATLCPGGGLHDNGVGSFRVDEVLKEKIHMLTEMMYEDEYDDTQDAVETRGVAQQCDASASVSSDHSEAGGDGIVPTVSDEEIARETLLNSSAGSPRRVRTLYDEKRFHEDRAKQRDSRTKAAKEARENLPVYAKKKKTVQKKPRDGKALTRAVRKGNVE